MKESEKNEMQKSSPNEQLDNLKKTEKKKRKKNT